MNHSFTYFFMLLCCFLSTPLAAQRTGFQLSVNKIGLDNTTEDVVGRSDTTSLFDPKYKRGSQDFGLTAGVTYRTGKCIFTIKSGYFQNYFRNTETEALPATYSIAEVKNKDYGIHWGLGVSKTLYSNKRLLLNYGISLDGTLGLKDYISICINHFDTASSFLAKSNANYKNPRTTTLFIAPSWSFNYFIYRNISLGIEYQYGLQFTRINGQFRYTKLIVDKAGTVLQDRYLTVMYKFKRLDFAHTVALNLNYNLNRQKRKD